MREMIDMGALRPTVATIVRLLIPCQDRLEDIKQGSLHVHIGEGKIKIDVQEHVVSAVRR